MTKSDNDSWKTESNDKGGTTKRNDVSKTTEGDDVSGTTESDDVSGTTASDNKSGATNSWVAENKKSENLSRVEWNGNKYLHNQVIDNGLVVKDVPVLYTCISKKKLNELEKDANIGRNF